MGVKLHRGFESRPLRHFRRFQTVAPKIGATAFSGPISGGLGDVAPQLAGEGHEFGVERGRLDFDLAGLRHEQHHEDRQVDQPFLVPDPPTKHGARYDRPGQPKSFYASLEPHVMATELERSGGRLDH
jgi:hypothetical protein